MGINKALKKIASSAQKAAGNVAATAKDPLQAARKAGGTVATQVKRATGNTSASVKQAGGNVATTAKEMGGKVASTVKDPMEAFQTQVDPRLQAAAKVMFPGLALPDAQKEMQRLMADLRGDTGNTGQGGAAASSGPSAMQAQMSALNPLAINPFAQITPAQLQAATIANPGRFGVNQFAGQQNDLLSLLQAQATGQGGPSPAELMLKANQDDQLRQQMALAATLGGRAAPTAQRQLMQQQAIGGQEALRQAAIMRAQEQLQAQGLYSGALQSAQGQALQQQGLLADVERANQQAWQAANMENARQAFESQTFGQQQELARIQAQEAAAQARRQTEAQLEIAKGTRDVDLMTKEAERQAAERASKRQFVGSVLGAGASAAATYAKGGA